MEPAAGRRGRLAIPARPSVPGAAGGRQGKGGDAAGTLAGSWHLRLAAKYHSGSPRSVPTLSHQAKSDGRGAKGLARAGGCGQGSGEVVAVAAVVAVVATVMPSSPHRCVHGAAGVDTGRAGGCRAVGPHAGGTWLIQLPTTPRPPPAPPWLHSHASLSLQPHGTARHAQTQPAFGTRLHTHTSAHAQACTRMHTHMHTLPNAHGVQAPADAGPAVPAVEAQPCRSADSGAFVCQAPPRLPRPHARHGSAPSPPSLRLHPRYSTRATRNHCCYFPCSCRRGGQQWGQEPGTGTFCPWEPDPITLCHCGRGTGPCSVLGRPHVMNPPYPCEPGVAETCLAYGCGQGKGQQAQGAIHQHVPARAARPRLVMAGTRWRWWSGLCPHADKGLAMPGRRGCASHGDGAHSPGAGAGAGT